jgi:hypothetical protein
LTRRFGATSRQIRTNDQVNRLCSEIAQKYPCMVNEPAVLLFRLEDFGTECRATGLAAPESGCPMAGDRSSQVAKAFGEFEIMQPAQHPKYFGAQATDVPITSAQAQHAKSTQKPSTIALARLGNPADGYFAMQTILASGGARTAEKSSKASLQPEAAVFAKPGGGVTVAHQLIQQGKLNR